MASSKHEPAPQAMQPLTTPEGKPITFRSRSLRGRHMTIMLFYLFGSLFGFSFLVALTANTPALQLMVALVAIAPIGGFFALSFLLNRKVTYHLLQGGIKEQVEPTFSYFTFIKRRTRIYGWNDISEFLYDEFQVLGRYGVLDIGLRKPPYSLRIMPVRKKEVPYFRRFEAAFVAEVSTLNADEDKRAVTVATIRQRKASFWRKPQAKALAIFLLLAFVSLVVYDLYTSDGKTTELGMFYIQVMLGALTLYVSARSFKRRLPYAGTDPSAKPPTS